MTDEQKQVCDHSWKFNGGNPMCSKCGTYRDDEVRVVLSMNLPDKPDVDLIESTKDTGFDDAGIRKVLESDD